MPGSGLPCSWCSTVLVRRDVKLQHPPMFPALRLALEHKGSMLNVYVKQRYRSFRNGGRPPGGSGDCVRAIYPDAGFRDLSCPQAVKLGSVGLTRCGGPLCPPDAERTT